MAKASSNLFPYVHLVPAAAPSSPAAGSERLYLDSGDGNKLKRKDSAGTVTTVESAGGSETFSDWTPALTAATTNPTLGTGGSVEGRYFQNGKHVEGDAVITFGTSGAAAGSGTYYVSLPVNIVTAGTGRVAGYGYIYDSSSGALRHVVLGRVTTSTVQLVVDNNAGLVSHTTPWAWGNNDVILLHLSYEAP